MLEPLGVESRFQILDMGRYIHAVGKLNPSTFVGKYGAVLDIGTRYAYFPENVYYAFKDAVSFSTLRLISNGLAFTESISILCSTYIPSA